MKHYTENQLSINNVTQLDENNVKISYSPMLETLFYSPGANIISKPDDDIVVVAIVRCSIKVKCEVTIEVEQDSESKFITIKNYGKPVYILSSVNKFKVYPII